MWLEHREQVRGLGSWGSAVSGVVTSHLRWSCAQFRMSWGESQGKGVEKAEVEGDQGRLGGIGRACWALTVRILEKRGDLFHRRKSQHQVPQTVNGIGGELLVPLCVGDKILSLGKIFCLFPQTEWSLWPRQDR